MSDQLPTQPNPNKNEEIDLGQLFKLIGNIFDRFFKFVASIFINLFLGFVWLVFFVKKHFLKFIIAGTVGIVLGIVLDKNSDPVYKSYATIKQNYPTGENIYNSISYYKDLIAQKDIATLKNALDIEESEAASILDFDIRPVVTENQKLENYDAYLKTLDSAVASRIKYNEFVKNTQDYTYEYQQISIKAKARNNFKKVFEKIIENISTNDFFKREQEKDLKELQETELSLIEALKQSDSLKNTYKRVLEQTRGKETASQTSITIEGAMQIDKTKELDLYKSDLELRQRLVENRRSQADKQFLIEVISSKQDSGLIDNKIKVLGSSVNAKKFYVIGLILITFIVLLGIDFIKFLEKYKNY
jgi:hypothetical protein